MIIAAVGLSAGLANMTDGNILFDGASLVLMLFALSTYATSVKPGTNLLDLYIINVTRKPNQSYLVYIAIKNISDAELVNELATNLKNIAAAHFIITLAITGIVGLQITHYVLNKRADNAERAEAVAAAAAKKSK